MTSQIPDLAHGFELLDQATDGPSILSARERMANNLVCGDARDVLQMVPDEAAQLSVFSPPYNLGKEYGQMTDRSPLDGWRDLLSDVVEQLFRLLKPDGKMCVVIGGSYHNTDEHGRYERVSLMREVINVAKNAGFDYYDQIIWSKNQYATHGGEQGLFGSYPYPRNFMINQQHEFILVFRKWVSDAYFDQRHIPDDGVDRKEDATLSTDEWREYTKSVWEIKPVDHRVMGLEHPAVYPAEVPQRLIKMYSFEEELVVDPFIGTGTTAQAALEENRLYFGVEQKQSYLNRAVHDRLTEPLGIKTNAEARRRSKQNRQQADESGQTQTGFSRFADSN